MLAGIGLDPRRVGEVLGHEDRHRRAVAQLAVARLRRARSRRARPCRRPSSSRTRRRARSPTQWRPAGERAYATHRSIRRSSAGSRCMPSFIRDTMAACALDCSVMALAAFGCNDPTYLAETAPIETHAGGDGRLRARPRPVRAAGAAADADRAAGARASCSRQLMLPDDVPWAQARDFDIEIEWSVKNLDTHEDDGASSRSTAATSSATTCRARTSIPTPNAGRSDAAAEPADRASRSSSSPARPSTGVFREDDLQESALDLEAITRYPSGGDALATPFMVIEHRSNVVADRPRGHPAARRDAGARALPARRHRRRARGHGLLGARARSQRQAGQADRQEPLRLDRGDAGAARRSPDDDAAP